jgi:hypothetical protein
MNFARLLLGLRTLALPLFSPYFRSYEISRFIFNKI